MSNSLTFAILGAGQRGRLFSDWLVENRGIGSVVAVADPNPVHRAYVSNQHQIPVQLQFNSDQEFFEQGKLADCLINTTQDQLHHQTAVNGFELGYHMLLEKPMATELEHCEEIVRAWKTSGKISAICHSLRHHLVYAKVKELLLAGEIGDVLSIDQLEGVDPQHQSHSFVRGNWGNTERSSFMLLAKCCHDVDVLQYLVGAPCISVASFGGLHHFTTKNQPEGATDRCLDGCAVEAECPYSAKKLYIENSVYAQLIGLDLLSDAERRKKVDETQYGKCAYLCDNDVVDHQVVTMQYANGATGSLTMTAFAPGGRSLRVHGSKGFLQANLHDRKIEIDLFWKGMTKSVIEVPDHKGGHGGGDDLLIRNFIEAIEKNDPSIVLTDPAESLATHRTVFAAEQSRISAAIQFIG